MSPFWKGFLRENFCRPDPWTYTLSDGRPRLAFVDLAKGIAIIMVMLTHTHDFCPAGVSLYRMPLYFIVCGMFFKEKVSLPGLIVRKTDRLLLPMAFFTVIGVLMYIIVGRSLPEISFSRLNVLGFVRGVNGPVWFLYTLFVGYILLWMVCRMFSSAVMRGVVVCVLACISARFHDVPGCAGLFCAMAAMPFLFVGYLLRGSRVLYQSAYDILLAVGGALVFCVVEYIAVSRGFGAQFGQNVFYGSRPVIYLLSTAGTLGVLSVLKCVGWLPVISYFGRYSVVSLCIHFPLMITLWELRDNYEWSWLADPAFTIVFFLVLWFLIPLSVRCFPYFCGQRDLFVMPDDKH